MSREGLHGIVLPMQEVTESKAGLRGEPWCTKRLAYANGALRCVAEFTGSPVQRSKAALIIPNQHPVGARQFWPWKYFGFTDFGLGPPSTLSNTMPRGTAIEAVS